MSIKGLRFDFEVLSCGLTLRHNFSLRSHYCLPHLHSYLHPIITPLHLPIAYFSQSSQHPMHLHNAIPRPKYPHLQCTPPTLQCPSPLALPLQSCNVQHLPTPTSRFMLDLKEEQSKEYLNKISAMAQRAGFQVSIPRFAH